MSSLNIKSTESFKEANKKTDAVALLNPDYPAPPALKNNDESEHPVVDKQRIINALYGDIPDPDKYRFKQQSKAKERKL